MFIIDDKGHVFVSDEKGYVPVVIKYDGDAIEITRSKSVIEEVKNVIGTVTTVEEVIAKLNLCESNPSTKAYKPSSKK